MLLLLLLLMLKTRIHGDRRHSTRTPPLLGRVFALTELQLAYTNTVCRGLQSLSFNLK